MDPRPLHMLFLLSENVPLKIKFSHSFHHLLCAQFLTTCLNLICTWRSQWFLPSGNLQSPRETNVNQIHHQCQMVNVSRAGEARPTGQIWELSEWCQVEVYETANIVSFLTNKKGQFDKVELHV